MTNTVASSCPICGAVTQLLSERYLGCVCASCVERAVDPGTGRPVVGLNAGFGGGFVAHYRNPGARSGPVCEQVTDEHVVLIDGREWWMDEARFGGTVVMPMPDSEQSPTG